jgi:hypothetical protein
MEGVTTMEHLWETLCDCLDEELERQHIVMAVCQAQRDALRAHEMEHMQAKTHALELLIHEASVAEKSRIRAVGALVCYLELPVERQTLTELVRIAPGPISRRLGELQRNLKELLAAIRAVVADTQDRLRIGREIADRTIRILVTDDTAPKVSYPTRRAADATPVLIDSCG